MKRTLLLALLGLMLLGGSLFALPVAGPSANVGPLEIDYDCTVEMEVPGSVFSFAPEADDPGSSSFGKGFLCDVYWSNPIAFVIHANGAGCVTFSCPDGFVYQTPAGPENPIVHFLDAELDMVNCGSTYAPHWVWGGTASNSMVGGTWKTNLYIGAERNGYADMAGTYIAVITIDCIGCDSL